MEGSTSNMVNEVNEVVSKEELMKWYDEDFCLHSLKMSMYNLPNVKNFSKRVTLLAVEKAPSYALKYIRPGKRLSYHAVTLAPSCIELIDIKKYPEIYDYYVLRCHLEDMHCMTKNKLLQWYNPQFCRKFVLLAPASIVLSKIRSDCLCKLVIKKDALSLQYLKREQTEALCLLALEQDLRAIHYVDIKRFPGVYDAYVELAKTKTTCVGLSNLYCSLLP